MKKVFNHKVWRRIGVAGGAFLAFFLAGKELAMNNYAVINSKLHVETSKTVEKDKNNQESSDYFPSAFGKDGLKKLKEYEATQARSIEEEGAVLLKNNNHALPLSNGSAVTLFGMASIRPNYSTSGSSSVKGVTYPTFQETLEAKGFRVNSKTLDLYTANDQKTTKSGHYGRTTRNFVQSVRELPWSKYDADTLSSIPNYGDAAIVVFARDSGEGNDVTTVGSDGEDGTYLSITKEEEELLQRLTELKKQGQIKKIVVLLNSAVPMETDFLFRDSIDIDSALWVGNFGSEGIKGIVDILDGSVNPSGHLSDTFLRDNLSSPAMASWMLNPKSIASAPYTNAEEYKLNSSQQFYINYVEGIYVGYRYYETRYEDKVLNKDKVGDFDYSKVVSYPFGYGLSYTNFTYSDYHVKESGDHYEVSVKVTNSGDTYSGKDVVQVYLQKPYTQYDIDNGIEKASVELVGFGKTKMLAPNESEEVKVDVKKEDFKTYDANKEKTYILEDGKYYLGIGHSAHDALNNILASKGYRGDQAGNPSLATVALTQDKLDAKIYSRSLETGAKITNQLDFADPNKYENAGDNHVNYVTRNNWEETFPKTKIAMKISGEKMLNDLSSNKEIPVGDAKMPTYKADNKIQLIQLRSTEKVKIDYDSEEWDKLLDQMSFEEQSLLVTNAAYNTVQIASIGKPATIDHNGPTAVNGTKTGIEFPSEGVWASSFNRDLIEEVGKAMAEDARFISMTGLYAPGVNIHRTPFAGRLHEYFSEDPYLNGMSAAYEICGMQSKGVIAFTKHFAFNDEESHRNGVGIWLNEQSAREIYLKSFELAMRPSIGNSHGIMTSFNRAGCIWTSASSELMKNISRGEWGFDGCSITDMAASNGASYMFYSDGIYNGTEMYDGSGTVNSLDEWKDNPAFAQEVRRACHRILYVLCNYSAAMNGISSTTDVIPITPWWETLLNVFIILNSVALGVGAVFYIASMILESKEKKDIPDHAN